MEDAKIYCFNGPGGRDPHEIILDLTADDRKAFDDLPVKDNSHHIDVTDQATGLRWRVRRSACSADCYCAAEAARLVGDDSEVIIRQFGSTPNYAIRHAFTDLSPSELEEPEFIVTVLEALAEAAEFNQDADNEFADPDRAAKYKRARQTLLLVRGLYEE